MVPLADMCNHRPGARAHFIRAPEGVEVGEAMRRTYSPSSTTAAPSVTHAEIFDGVDGERCEVKEPMQHVPLPSVPPPSILLVTGAPTPADAEIFITYGAKSNEELLVYYGFALEENVADKLEIAVLRRGKEWRLSVGGEEGEERGRVTVYRYAAEELLDAVRSAWSGAGETIIEDDLSAFVRAEVQRLAAALSPPLTPSPAHSLLAYVHTYRRSLAALLLTLVDHESVHF